MMSIEQEYQRAIALMQRMQRRMAELEQENMLLRTQLDALRRGVGIMVSIQGQTLPVTVQPAEVSALSGGAISAIPAVSYSTGAMPVVSPLRAQQAQCAQQAGQHPSMAFAAPAHAQPPSVQGAAMPSLPRIQQPIDPTYAPAQPSWPSADESWLTGPIPAITPEAAALPYQQGQPRSVRPSQWVTPTWLRDADVQQPQPAQPSTAPCSQVEHQWPQQQQQRASVTSEQGWPTAQRKAVRARPLGRPYIGRPSTPRLEPIQPMQMPTLAQITGQQRAVRPQRQASDEQTPFSDSFML